MTKRYEIQKYIRALTEIDDIMSAMKNFAFLELNKLSKFSEQQTRVVQSIDEIGTDFLSFSETFGHPAPIPESQIYILIGSERGFCGNLNNNIIKYFKNITPSSTEANQHVIVVGHKLASKINITTEQNYPLNGPNVSEEITNIILELLNLLEQIETKLTTPIIKGNWKIIYAEYLNNQIKINTFNPVNKLFCEHKRLHRTKAILDTSEKDFFLEYLNEYLFANLYYIFYQTLISENYQRLHHIQSAKSKLEKKTIQLNHQMNVLRQEEIIEEIENILLSVKSIHEEIDAKIIINHE